MAQKGQQAVHTPFASACALFPYFACSFLACQPSAFLCSFYSFSALSIYPVYSSTPPLPHPNAHHTYHISFHPFPLFPPSPPTPSLFSVRGKEREKERGRDVGWIFATVSNGLQLQVAHQRCYGNANQG
ncbi:hypothetical protein GQ54DRAFT_116085 [Martensiomyces pterosporus]|nr:hypothetical protein GQ54DRAFT_116085 [Martensiomyces pterosporus]